MPTWHSQFGLSMTFASFLVSARLNRRLHLDSDHMFIHNTQRVRALIMEEHGIFNDDISVSRRGFLRFILDDSKLFDASLSIHIEGLRVAKQIYGDESFNVAKYHGNLGRLYQARGEYELVSLRCICAFPYQLLYQMQIN